jgi:CRP-like cAMP-binding protein
MTIAQKENIATILIKEVFSPGEFIVHEGDNADSYYIIKSVPMLTSP